MESTIRLFKALPIAEHGREVVNSDLMKQTVPRGFVFTPEVIAHYPDTADLVSLVDAVYGRDSEQLNQTFHKSFAKVKDASIQQLAVEQMIHYLTTYGAELFSAYDQDSVYIPAEVLEAPELKDDVGLVIIRGLTKKELRDKLLSLLSSGIALHENTISDVLDVATFVGLEEPDLKQVSNKEVRAALFDYLGLVPTAPVEFLRYVIYRVTGKTLLIKNHRMLQEIRDKGSLQVVRYFDLYEEQVGLHRLAEIFLRFKPIFLALRTNMVMRNRINRIRRLATKHHKPMPEDLLNNITAILKHDKVPNRKWTELHSALGSANIFRLIRLAYALRYRTTDADSILYHVRNGKSFATDFHFPAKYDANVYYDVVLREISDRLRNRVEGKRIYIPEGISYALPATEKRFTGHLPSGTSVEVTEDLIFGIHWTNQRGRVDLDLSLTNSSGKFGWDGRYRDRSSGIYFSGDVTDAPKPRGASEVFHVGQEARGTWLLYVNYFNYRPDDPEFKIVVGQENRRNITRNYTVDPNNIRAFSNSVLDVREKLLGIIVADDEGTTFYFAESDLGNRISSWHDRHDEQALRYLAKFHTNAMSLRSVLEYAGAEFVDNAADVEIDIDLSPEAVDKLTFVELLTGA